MVHCPLALVFGPALSHVLVTASRIADAPFEFVNVKSTCSPAAATKPLPESFCRLTANVCAASTASLCLLTRQDVFRPHRVFPLRRPRTNVPLLFFFTRPPPSATSPFALPGPLPSPAGDRRGRRPGHLTRRRRRERHRELTR